MTSNNFNMGFYKLRGRNVALSCCVLVYFYYLYRTHTADYKLRDDLNSIQKAFLYAKPRTAWEYNNSWRQIGNATNHQIYSAYFDDRLDIIPHIIDEKAKVPIGSLRIFAILPAKFRERISCIIRFEDFTMLGITAHEVAIVHEDHEFPFAAFTIMCPLYVPRNLTTVHLPQAVALSYASNRLSHISPTFVPISYPRDMEQLFTRSRPVLSICVGPLQFYYSNVLRIVEFVEMYRLLGAGHFYFYHLNASEDVLRLLQHYQREGVADVLQWNLPDSSPDIHYGGIVAQYNDCTYRAMVVDNYRYTAIVDLDEIIMPLKHNSLRSMLHQCDEGRTSAFVYRNVFFHKNDSNDTFSVPPHARNRFLYTQTKVRRTLEIQPPYVRSKCIVNTRAIVEMGNHYVYRAAPGYSDHMVHQTVGLLFHYRDQCLNCKALLIVDYTARRFGSLIWDRVDDTCLRVFMENRGVCTA